MNFASLRARAISYRDMGAFTMRNALRTHSRPGEVTVSSRDDSWVSTHGALVNTDTPVAVTMANGTLVTDPDTNSALSEWDVPVVHRGRYTLPLELARVSNAALRFMSKGRHPVQGFRAGNGEQRCRTRGACISSSGIRGAMPRSTRLPQQLTGFFVHVNVVSTPPQET